MHKRTTSFLAASAMALAMFSSSSLAADAAASGPNLGAPAADAGLTAVSKADAAMTLATLGREQGDPKLLAAAGRALLMIGSTPAEDKPTSGTLAEDEKAGTGDAPEKAETAQTGLPSQLFAEARRLARGNEQTLALIETMAAVGSRGSLAGPHKHQMRISARSYRSVKESYRAGELAEVAILGDGDTDVDLIVQDANGNEICRSTRGGDREYCQWTPAWTGEFTIKVANYGRVYNDVTFLTN